MAMPMLMRWGLNNQTLDPLASSPPPPSSARLDVMQHTVAGQQQLASASRVLFPPSTPEQAKMDAELQRLRSAMKMQQAKLAEKLLTKKMAEAGLASACTIPAPIIEQLADDAGAGDGRRGRFTDEGWPVPGCRGDLTGSPADDDRFAARGPRETPAVSITVSASTLTDTTAAGLPAARPIARPEAVQGTVGAAAAGTRQRPAPNALAVNPAAPPTMRSPPTAAATRTPTAAMPGPATAAFGPLLQPASLQVENPASPPASRVSISPSSIATPAVVVPLAYASRQPAMGLQPLSPRSPPIAGQYTPGVRSPRGWLSPAAVSQPNPGQCTSSA